MKTGHAIVTYNGESKLVVEFLETCDEHCNRDIAHATARSIFKHKSGSYGCEFVSKEFYDDAKKSFPSYRGVVVVNRGSTYGFTLRDGISRDLVEVKIHNA